ncbi:MAG: class I SAM-dependent methyltransferase [Calditrichaeota bacterium]|nr:class I SAM-dependent methyltransferase [Calditrichota bacterium]
MGSGERQAKFWGPGAKIWQETHEAYSLPVAEWVLDRVLKGHAMHVLDTGCGSGGSVELATQRGARVTGTDVAPEMLKLCKARVPAGEYHIADTESLPFEDQSFDAVLALNSLQFCESPQAALRELIRVARPGAPIGIALFGAASESDFAKVGSSVRKLFDSPPAIEGPFALSPPAKLHKLIAETGLKILESTDMTLTREFASFEDYWTSQAGTASTRYTISVLGEEPVRKAMREACLPLQDIDGRVHFSNSFHAVICRKADI